MRTIVGKSEIWSYFDESPEPRLAKNNDIRSASGHPVNSYLELATKIATLQYRNPEHILLFRGQSNDHKNQFKNSSLRPSLFRPATGAKKVPNVARLIDRFDYLKRAETALIEHYTNNPEFLGADRIRKYRVLRWSILQHYEICFTPLLDVTHSLRIAASFASDTVNETAYFYVLGLPNISGSITASAESGVQIIRLSSVCPPAAMRPHIQEGYLLGEYPDMPDIDQKQHYKANEIDFGRRLIAKFRLNPNSFWDGVDFPRITHAALYPDTHDPLFRIAKKIKKDLGPQE
jgi:hypothetical protein